MTVCNFQGYVYIILFNALYRTAHFHHCVVFDVVHILQVASNIHRASRQIISPFS